jgi:hypothetical protein
MLNEPCQGSWAAGGFLGFILRAARPNYKINLAGRSGRGHSLGESIQTSPLGRGLTAAAAGQVN